MTRLVFIYLVRVILSYLCLECIYIEFFFYWILHNIILENYKIWPTSIESIAEKSATPI